LDDEKIGYLRRASGLVWDQIAMIDTLLDISRLESSEMPLTFEDCDMAELVEKAINRVANADGRHPIRFDRPSESVRASCDSAVIRRVLANLLDNAAKFSPADSEIRVHIAQEAGAIAVSVTDQGIGIAKAHWDRIFERFGQAPDQSGRPHSTGLGLTFCKLAVEAHGGRIGVESEVGQGSTFRFTLRPAPAALDPDGR
jgi:signal transduction histidine kinase